MYIWNISAWMLHYKCACQLRKEQHLCVQHCISLCTQINAINFNSTWSASLILQSLLNYYHSQLFHFHNHRICFFLRFLLTCGYHKVVIHKTKVIYMMSTNCDWWFSNPTMYLLINSNFLILYLRRTLPTPSPSNQPQITMGNYTLTSLQLLSEQFEFHAFVTMSHLPSAAKPSAVELGPLIQEL